MFEQVPNDIHATEVIEAAIYDRTQVGDAVGLQMWLLQTRVDRMIKGSINTYTMKILVYQGCRFGGHCTVIDA